MKYELIEKATPQAHSITIAVDFNEILVQLKSKHDCNERFNALLFILKRNRLKKLF